MALMRSPPGVPIAVPQYRRSRSLYEWPGLAGSPGDAILSAVTWVDDGGAAVDEAFVRDGDARARAPALAQGVQARAAQRAAAARRLHARRRHRHHPR